MIPLENAINHCKEFVEAADESVDSGNSERAGSQYLRAIRMLFKAEATEIVRSEEALQLLDYAASKVRETVNDAEKLLKEFYDRLTPD